MSKYQGPTPDTDQIILAPLEEVMHQSMMPYAEHVIMERALPRVEDGLKPVQRRILYTMLELSLSADKPHRKCARIVGDCLGKYHPHGDSSVYDALVRMAQDFSMRGPLVDGHGNFGSIDGDSAAAMRYTEARMAPLAQEMLRDIDKDCVDFKLNFDDTMKEPDILPSPYPNLLVNGAGGIAVGLATNIPPHNLRETIAAVRLLLDKPEATLDEVMAVLPAPDFPTGGVLIDNAEMRQAYETGRGKLTLRAKVDIEPGRAGRHLLAITEMPYQVNKAQMLEKILKLSEDKKAALGAIQDIRDESDRSGLRAVIEIKKDADPETILSYLLKYSDLQVTFGVNMVAIADGRPRQMGLIEVLSHYITHQKTVLTRRSQYELARASERAHIVEGLIKAIDVLDEVIALIRKSKNGKEAREGLMATFGFTQAQAQAILDLRLQRLTGLEILALRQEDNELKKTIARLEGILKSPAKLVRLMHEELSKIADTYGDERRTRILCETQAPQAMAIVETVVPDDCVVIVTRGKQLKRVSPRLFEKLEPATEPDDVPEHVFFCQTDHNLVFFTNLGNCYRLRVDQLEEQMRTAGRGLGLPGVLSGLEEGEEMVGLFCLPPDDMKNQPDFLFFTKQGLVKRSEAADYDSRRSKLVAVNLTDGDVLKSVSQADPGRDLCCLSKRGYIIRFSLEDVPLMGRAARGVKAIRLAIDDELLWAGTLGASDQLVIFTERGYGKRILGSLVDVQRRGGKGVSSFLYLKSGNNGSFLAAMARLTDPANFSILQADGTQTSFHSEDITCQALSERGKPYVMALLNRVVTDLIL